MIDGVGRAGPPRAVAAGGEAVARAQAAPRAGETTGAMVQAAGGQAAGVQEAVVSNLGRVAKDLAASPPVDTARVAALRLAIASGDYKPDPDRIAAAMIALETPPKA